MNPSVREDAKLLGEKIQSQLEILLSRLAKLGETTKSFNEHFGEKTIADYAAIIETPDGSEEVKGTAYGMRGWLLFRERDDVQGLLKDTQKALEYDRDAYSWRYNLGLAKLFLGEPGEALEHCLPAIDDCDDASNIDKAMELLKEKSGILPEVSKGAYEKIVSKLKERKRELG